MRYQITGKQIDIGEALQTHVKDNLTEVIEKYAGRPQMRPSYFHAMLTNMSVRRRYTSPPD